MNLEQERNKLVNEIRKNNKQLEDKRELQEERLLEILKTEDEIEQINRQKDSKRKRILEIEEIQCEQISLMSWETTEGISKKRQKKLEIQEQIKDLKKEKWEVIKEYNNLNYRNTKHLITIWDNKLEKRNLELEQRIDYIKEQIELFYDNLAKIYEN